MTPRTLNCLIRDVFRRAAASGFLYSSVLAIVAVVGVCLTLRRTDDGLQLLGWTIDPASDDAAVRMLLFRLAFVVGDVLGVLVTLIAMAGFLPDFLDPSAVTVLLCKPPARSVLLIGRFLGIVLLVVLLSGLLVGGLAAAVWLKTGVFELGFLLAWPLLVTNYIAFAAAGALIAVSTRSTVSVMMGSIIFALISWGVSFGKHVLSAIQVEEARPAFGRLVGLAYWLLPKPVDSSLLLYDQLGMTPDGLTGLGLKPVLEKGLYSPGLAAASTLAIAAGLIGLAVYELNHQDY
ncbi:MAG: hypothetical protein K1X57_12935 [Gemmataceae bacterium]|nr:hypothetical protein [Gemmataceae bacterium]